MNALVVGASAGLGRALAEQLAAQGHALVLVASDERDLKALSAHLALKHGVRVEFVACHVAAGGEWLQRVIAAAAAFGPMDALFFPIGFSSAEDNGALGEAASRQILEANMTGIMLLAGHFLTGMLKAGRGYIVGFGSVAAIRGRRTNVVYAAAKRGLVSYFESIRHLSAGSGIRVQIYQMGYLDTQQAFGRKLLLPKANPEQVARVVMRDLEKDFGSRYFPAYWAGIDLIVRWMPWFIYKRMQF